MFISRIELHVVAHCNLRCRGCNHASPYLEKELVEIAKVDADLQEIVRLGLRSKILRILGGEPLLHPNLLEIIRLVKRSHICEEVHVVTNGTLLNRTNDEFWNEIDLVDMSLYPNTSVYLPEPHEAKLRVTYIPYFNETFSTTRHADDMAVTQVWNECEIRNFCYGIVNGYFFKCMRAPYLGRFLNLPNGDGLELRGTTVEALEAYINNCTPLEACKYCTGTSGKRFEHSQVSREEWLRIQSRPISEMLD